MGTEHPVHNIGFEHITHANVNTCAFSGERILVCPTWARHAMRVGCWCAGDDLGVGATDHFRACYTRYAVTITSKLRRHLCIGHWIHL